MAELIKNGDFVEIDYSGYIAESKELFDTTLKEVAKKEGIEAPDANFHPSIICIGKGSTVMGLEEQLVGKEIGKQYKIELDQEKAFGKKDPKLMRIMNTNAFLKEQIRPIPGLQVDVDGMTGTVRSVTGGRTVVDFNHPLAGKAVWYDVKVNKAIVDPAVKAKALFAGILRADPAHVDVEFKEGKATIHSHFNLPKEITDQLKGEFTKTIPEIKEIDFLVISDENHKHHHH